MVPMPAAEAPVGAGNRASVGAILARLQFEAGVYVAVQDDGDWRPALPGG